MMEGSGENVCKCHHHKFIPLLIVLFGLLFLGGNLEWWGWGVANAGWPGLVIIGGAMKMMEGKCKCR